MTISSSSSFSYQQGVGLIEVMVALLLLAIAVLGFSAMQMSAVKATDESLMRTRALTVIRGGAEMMRFNPKNINDLAAGVNATDSAVTVGGTDIDANSCMSSSTSCSPAQLATQQGLMIRQHASDNDLDIRVATCPQTGTTTIAATSTASATSITGQMVQCFIASWGTTAPVLSDTLDSSSGKTVNCGTADGTYNREAQCFIMEAY